MKKLLSLITLLFFGSLAFSQIIITSTVTNVSCFGGADGAIALSSSGGTAPYTYSWTPTLPSSPNVSNLSAGTYLINVVDANGCRNSDTVTVFVYPEIKIPNGFTPNADGKNDYWQLDLIYMFPDNEVEVYNRWGEQLFYSKGYAVPFNGQYKGKDLPVGTYYYIINLNHPSYPKPYTGPLTIFR